MTPSATETLLARFSALADPARLRLLHLLAGNELGVMELADILQMPQSSVSRHLKVLVDQGFLASRGERTTNLYTMPNGDLAAAAQTLWRLARQETERWPAVAQDRLRLEQRLAARKQDAGAFFAGVAGEWERLRTELYGDRFTAAALLALLPATWVVADLACGSGTVTAELAPHVRRVIAIDNSPEMLQAAKRRTQGHANVELRRGDLAALPLTDGSCDAALLLLALTHVPAPELALAEMARILRPGGRAVIVDLLHHDRDEFRRRMAQHRLGFEARELRSLLTAQGFTAVACRPLPPESHAKGPALLLATGTRAEQSVPTRKQIRQPASRPRRRSERKTP